jgi:glycosyltransferase involved in cell wall biosynthesis
VSPEEADVCVFLDVSHVNFPRLAQPELRSTPKVFLIHDILPIQHPEWFPEGASRGYRLFLRQVLAVANHVVVSSRHGADQVGLLDWPTSAQMHVIPLGSHITALRHLERSPDADYSLLYVSTIEPRKGHDLLLDTFDVLLREGHDVLLTLVGRQGWDVARNWEVGDLVRRIREHPEYGTRLHWHEKASDSDVAQLAATATHGVIPAIDEGFGLFLEEALGLGLTVVASDIPVFAERPHPRLRLAPRTPEAFADAILDNRVTVEPYDAATPVRTFADAASDWAELLGTLA